MKIEESNMLKDLFNKHKTGGYAIVSDGKNGMSYEYFDCLDFKGFKKATNDYIEHEYKLLKAIAYCAHGMISSENDRNFGDADEWERHLRDNLDEYIENDYDIKSAYKERNGQSNTNN